MSIHEKSLIIASILQTIPTLGVPIVAYFADPNDTSAATLQRYVTLDKFFGLIDSIADIIQTTTGLTTIIGKIINVMKKARR
jgi:hypothetical protein